MNPTLGARLLLLALVLLTLGGCTTLAKATRSEPIELDPGERSLGMRMDDSQIETIAAVNISKTDKRLDEAPISVDSYNAVVLLTGQVPSKDLRQLAGETVNAIHTVRQVHNELEVSDSIGFGARSNDTWLGTKVKTKLYASRDVEGGRVKVVAENGSIYLMGLVTRAEADRITDIVRNTGGVERVVRVFEYID